MLWIAPFRQKNYYYLCFSGTLSRLWQSPYHPEIKWCQDYMMLDDDVPVCPLTIRGRATKVGRQFLSYGTIYTAQEEQHKVKAELTFDLDGGKFNELV